MSTFFIAVTKGLGWVTLTIKTNLLFIILEVLGNGLDCLDPDEDYTQGLSWWREHGRKKTAH